MPFGCGGTKPFMSQTFVSQTGTATVLAREPRSSEPLSARLVWVVLVGWAAVWFAARAWSGAYSWHFFWLGSGLLVQPGLPGGGLHLYAAHPQLQIGPLALAATIPFRLLGVAAGGLAAGAVSMAAALAAMYLLTRRPGRERPVEPMLVLTTGLLLVPVWSEVAVRYTHLDDVLAVAFAVAALHALRKQLPFATGLLLAAAVDSKPWAAAFAVLVLALPGRRRIPAVIGLAAGVILVWAPFLLADAGTLAIGQFQIDNVASSALNALGVHMARTPWWDRPAQLVAGLLAGAILVRRGRPEAVMFAAIASRLLLDPQTYPYYTSGLVLAAACLDLLASSRRVPWWTMSVAAFWIIDAVGIRTLPAGVRGEIRAVYCLAAVALLVTCSLRRRRPQPGSSTPPRRYPSQADRPRRNENTAARVIGRRLRGAEVIRRPAGQLTPTTQPPAPPRHSPSEAVTIPLPAARAQAAVRNSWSAFADHHAGPGPGL